MTFAQATLVNPPQYAGRLEDPNGTPLSGMRDIKLTLLPVEHGLQLHGFACRSKMFFRHRHPGLFDFETGLHVVHDEAKA